MPIEYTCSVCGGVFQTDEQDDLQAVAEFEFANPGEKIEDAHCVCDKCWELPVVMPATTGKVN